jgi:signal transduction histidine kinase
MARIALWLTALAVFALTLASTPFETPHVPMPHGDVLVVAVISAAVVLLVRWWRWPLYATAVIGWLTVAVWPLIAVASYRAGLARRRAEIAVYAAVITPALLLPYAVSGTDLFPTAQFPAYGVPLVAVLVALPMVAGLWVASRREVRAGVRERAAQLEREQAARFEQARAEERARIAREMHDVVAHRVSLMVLHAGALEVNSPDQSTAAAAALIRTTGREALADLRDVLGVLRSPDAALQPQPMLADLDPLIDQSRAVGIQVGRRDEGEVRSLPAAVQRAAYRVVQEALTNVHKHAADAATDIVLRYLPGAFEVTVRNAAPARLPAPLPGSGLGLAGLRERVELLGGEFDARRRIDGGFLVLARLPTEDPT